jgi:glucose/arabinose dehydrogenase
MRVLTAALVVLVASVANATSASAVVLPSGFQDHVAIGGLDEPSAVRFAPDGHVFVAEKTGKILVYDSLEDATPDVFADIRTQVYDTGDRGLLGLEVDPQFPTRPYVYALYTYDHVLGEGGEAPEWGTPETSGDTCPKPGSETEVDACPVSGRLVRLTASGDHAVAETPLVEDWCQQFSSHSIGDLRFGADGALYASGGDGASFLGVDYGQFGWPEKNTCGDPPGGKGVALSPPTGEGGALRSQDLRTPADPTDLNGSIIRIDPDTGEGFAGNPMQASLDANARRIVAYGFRNPFRFAIDPSSGEVYAGHVGWSTWESIDRFPGVPGSPVNFGWPCYEGPEPTGPYEAVGLDLCEALFAEPAAVTAPFFTYTHNAGVVPGDECDIHKGSALAGMAFYEGSSYPAMYDGALFFADSVRGCIYTMLRGEDGEPQPATVAPFLTEGGNYPGIDIEMGPDGDLYYLSLFGPGFGDGALHRIAYAPGAPQASLKADPLWGDEMPLEVHFDAGESEDPEGETLTYDWDLNGDGTYETPGGAQMPQIYTDGTKNRTVGVKVTDEEALSSVAQVTVYPGDTPPEPKIEEPLPTHLWSVGETIHLSGKALDDEGTLGGSRLYWRTRLLHCPFSACHAHPLQVFPATKNADLIAPDHDLPSHIEISLSGTDGRGLSATKTISIDPRAVNLEVASAPAGLTLGAGLTNATAPFQLAVIDGSNVVLTAPQAQSLGGATYTWAGWSDGGARVHAVKANSSATYTAAYTTPAGPTQPEATGTPPPPPAPPVPPNTILGRHPLKRSRASTAKFVLSSSATASTFRCRLDRTTLHVCRSSLVFKHLKPGKHVLEVVAVDPTGQVDPSPLRFNWTVLPPKRKHDGR